MLLDRHQDRTLRLCQSMIAIRYRKLLYQAALVASNHNPALKPFARRLKEKGKPHKLVLIAVARKIIVIANALLAKNSMWMAR